MSTFTNCYYKRTAGTPKACFVCYRPTTTVLSTVNTVDWIYTCDGHLTDPGFASPLAESSDGAPKKTGLTPEQIAEVTKHWEERQKRKQEKAKEKEKEKDGKAEEEKADKDKKDKDTKPATPKATTPGTPASPPAPSHPRYTLHRDMFALRLAEHRKRRQAAQAKELAPRLPGAPRQPLPDA